MLSGAYDVVTEARHFQAEVWKYKPGQGSKGMSRESSLV